MGRPRQRPATDLLGAADRLARLDPPPSLVSIDVFDTLLRRYIPAHAVETAAAERLAAALSLTCRERGKRAPAAAEIVQSRRSFRRRRERLRRLREVEWLLDDWLAELASQLELGRATVVRLGRQVEREVELATTTLAPGAVALVKAAAGLGATVVLTSDTQHDGDALGEIVGRYDLAVTAIYSSGEVGLSKRFGGLFSYLEARHQVRSSHCLHIGDHWKSDLLRPLQKGWRAIRVARDRGPRLTPVPTRRLTRPTRRRLATVAQALAAHPPMASSSPLFDLAFDVLAPLAALLALFRWRTFAGLDVGPVFYIARDAKLILESDELLRPVLPDGQTWHYVRLSRRAMTLAHPADLLLSLRGMAGKAGKRTIGEFLGQFALPEGLDDELMDAAGLEPASPWTPATRSALGREVQSRRSRLEQLAQEQRELIADYLGQQTHEPLDRVGIIDTGWAGTAQDAISASLPEAALVAGCYLGVSRQGAQPSPRSLKFGLLRDDFRPHRHENAIDRMAGTLRLWDILLREPIGTVERLHRTADGRVEPVLAEAVPGPTATAAFEELRSGLRRGVEARRDGLAALVAVSADWSDDVLRSAASCFSRQLVAKPSRRLAEALLALDYEEGSAGESRSSLGLEAVRRGTAWYPGLLARYGLRFGQPPLEWLAELARALQKNGSDGR